MCVVITFIGGENYNTTSRAYNILLYYPDFFS